MGIDDASDRLVALSDGMLSVWDTRTAAMLGEPVRLGSTPEEVAWYQRNGDFSDRPGHPHQIAITAPDGSLELWDIEQRRQIRTIPTSIPTEIVPHFGEVEFDSTGDRLVYVGANSTIEMWDAETATATGAPIAAPGIQSLLGFDSAGYLITEDESSVNFWDLEAGHQSGSLRLPTGVYGATVEDGQRIDVGGSFELPYQLPITAEQWFGHLCRTLNRGFTEFERTLLPPETDLSRPCSKGQ